MLKLDLKPGQSISIGNAIVTLEKKSGQIATLTIDADKSVPIKRLAQAMDSIAAEHGIFHATNAA